MGDKGLLETAYDSFFLRDIAYIVSGLWLMLHLDHIMFNYCLTQFIEHLTTSTLAFLAYGTIGYFVGMLSYLTALHIKVIHTDPPCFKDNYDKARNKINNSEDKYIIKTLERGTFIQMACFSLGASSFLAMIAHAICLIIEYFMGSNSTCSFDTGYFFAALIVGSLAIFIGLKEVIDEDDILNDFAGDLADSLETGKKVRNTPLEPRL